MQAVDYLFGLTPLSFNTAAATVPDAGIVDANSIQPLLFSPAQLAKQHLLSSPADACAHKHTRTHAPR